MLPTLFSSLAGLLTFAVFDYVWLAVIAKDFYLKNLESHITLKDGSLVPYLPAAPFVYIIAIIGISIFVLPKAGSLYQAVVYGALFGFVAYAFYDFTNLATLKDYSWSLALIDILWGTFLVSIVTGVMFFVKTVR